MQKQSTKKISDFRPCYGKKIYTFKKRCIYLKGQVYRERKGKGKVRERVRELFHLLIHSAVIVTGSVGPDKSQKPRIPFTSPMWMEGAQAFEPSSTAVSGTIAGS